MIGERSTATREWSLAFAGGPSGVPRGFHPLADEWQDIDHRERLSGIPSGQPILISRGLADYRLGDYFRSAFRADQKSTAGTYAVELRTWFDFLARRGQVGWDEAAPGDVRKYQNWRVYDEDNPRRVGAATWNKGWEALRHFYDWSTQEGFTDENPVRSAQRLRDRETAQAHREKNARSSRDRWLTPLEYALWREVGLRGYDVERDARGNLVAGHASPHSRSRNTARNKALVDYGVTSGLRREEIGALLSFELPSDVDEEAGVVGKGAVFRRYRVVHRMGLESVSDYMKGERRDVIRRARKAGRYRRTNGRVVEEILDGRRGHRVRLDDGRVLDVPSLTVSERASLMLPTVDGPEPAWLWLGGSGEPLKPESWKDVFEVANRRVTIARANAGIQSAWVTVTPHSLRFTFALYLLLAGIRSIDEELGISGAAPFAMRNYSQAFDEVRDLLGHSSTATTRKYYLEPVKSLRASRFMRGSSITEMWDGLRDTSPLIGFGGLG